MFNLFSKPATIEQIHNDFDSAQERLLEQAKQIIGQNDSVDKAERLRKIGFVNSKTVTGSNIVVRSKQEAETIEYYKQEYPFLKFITESELNRLCDKYNLIYAPIDKYIEDVPEKNISEIEQTKMLRYSDSPKRVVLFSVDCSISELTKEEKMQAKRGVEIEAKDIITWDNSGNLSKYFGKPVTCEYNSIHSKAVEINKEGLFIAAPPSHFNKEGLTKHGKHGFFKVTIQEVKDPIVFRYCRGGVQIITKWGLEASDEIVVNEKMN